MGNQKKAEQLGMPYGTANARLNKMIIFSLIQELGKDVCFRCGEKIEAVTELSTEHKLPWLDVDPALFWDLDNIAWSHLSCNSRAGAPPFSREAIMKGANLGGKAQPYEAKLRGAKMGGCARWHSKGCVCAINDG